MKRRFGGLPAVLVLALAVGAVTGVQVGVSPRSGLASADASTGSAGLFVPAVGRLLDTRNGTGGYSSPTFRPTRTTHNTVFTATMFNGAPNARHGGSVIRHSRDRSDTYSYVWPNRDLTWDYFHYNHTMWDKNTATQFNWSAPEYRGHYYFYVRSPSSHTNRLGSLARYAFREPIYGGLPQDAYGHGWHR